MQVRMIPIALILLTVSANGASGDEGSWQPLFNGTNLDGWYTYRKDAGRDADPDGMFQVQDGVIHIYKDVPAGAEVPAGYFASDAEYSYFHLRFQYKWGGKRFAPRTENPRDSGLLYHVTGDDTIWPRSIECQVQERDTGDCWTVVGAQVDTTADPKLLKAGVVKFLEASAGGVSHTQGSPGVSRVVKNGTHEVDGWNTVEVIVRGDEEAVHIVNGNVNFRATNLRQLGPDGKQWIPLTHGRILFQAEYAEVLYRNIEIRPIPEGPLQPAGSSSASRDRRVQPSRLVAGPGGGFTLSADAAELFGPVLQTSGRYQVLDGWKSATDRAVWHLQEVKAGRYRVVTFYECMTGCEGQEFVLDWEDGQGALRGKTQMGEFGYGFIERAAGDIELPDGDLRITFRPGEDVKDRFVTLRSIRLIPIDSNAIRVLQGFVIEPVATAPLVTHPMVGCLDERGRLFLAESSGENGSTDFLTKTEPHRIVVLEDTDSDGRYDRRTVFADKLVQPNGVQWHAGALYITEPPGVWRLEDTDGDGEADRREHIQARFPVAEMHDGLHGAVLGPDGRIYWCGSQRGWLLGKPSEITQSPSFPLANSLTGVFSCRADGSDGRAFGLIGAANPVEITFTDEGEPIGTIAVYSYGAKGRDDAVVHWVPGVIGIGNTRPYDAISTPLTGELPEPLSRRGHSATSGITRYRSGQFGSEYVDNLFLAEFNMHAVMRLVIERSGATFRQLSSEPFVTSDDPYVHFTDVLEDADGSLLVIDTGMWFRHGCPTSSIDDQNVSGAIYRVRRSDAPPVDDPRGLKIAWETATVSDLVGLLDDDRFSVRDRAVQELSQRGEAAEEALAKTVTTGSVRARRNALWTLCRIDSPTARAAITSALDDEQASVRLTAARCLATVREPAARDRLLQLVATDDPAVCREAASALAHIGDPAAVPAILEAFRAPVERHLEHVLINSLIELDCPEPTAAGLADSHPAVQRAALIALDRMPHGELSREQVTPLLDTANLPLKESAIDVIRRRGWSDQILELARQWIATPTLDDQQANLLRGVLSSFLTHQDVSALVADRLAHAETPAATRIVLLEAMASAVVDPVPAEWLDPLGASLQPTDPAVALAAVNVLATHDCQQLDEPLAALARNQKLPPPLRLAALEAIVERLEQFDDEMFDFAVSRLAVVEEDGNPMERISAAKILGAAPLDGNQLERLVEVIPQSTPLELPLLLPAFRLGTDDALGMKLVTSLHDSSAAWTLSEQHLTDVLGRYSQNVQSAGEPLVARLRDDNEQRKSRLAELKPLLVGGDVERGRQVFLSSKASCTACHRALERGAIIGPDLSRIGAIRNPTDLLESVVFPSATIVQGFEPRSVATASGKVYTGILARQTADAVFLRTAEHTEKRIAREEIDGIDASSISIMPQGFDKTLTRNELRDLLTFLSSLK